MPNPSNVLLVCTMYIPQGDGCEMGICGFGNGEAQWYRKENVGVMDGKLIMTSKSESYAGNIYTSAKVRKFPHPHTNEHMKTRDESIIT